MTAYYKLKTNLLTFLFKLLYKKELLQAAIWTEGSD